MGMRLLLSLALVSCAFSRGRNDGSALIQAVTETAKMAKTWRIEGSIQESQHAQPATFTLLMRGTAEVRFQQNGGSTPAVIVCDKANVWVYSPPLNRYRTQPISQDALCSPIASDWKYLSSSLQSP